ncbi:MAG: hypothetical protein Q8O55_04995 [Dehalococcoidales bacterium]|nr:hypothetical protein [Dehalococcoidales bacterium]
MSVEAILAAVSFVGLFTAWVILPSRLCKRRADKETDGTCE